MITRIRKEQRLDALSAQFCLRIFDADRLMRLFARWRTRNFSLTDANLNSKEIALRFNLLLRRNEKVNKLPSRIYKAHINPLLCARFLPQSMLIR